MVRSVTRLGIVMSLLASLAVALAPGGSAATSAPTLRMFTVLHHSDVLRCCNDPTLYIDPGIYVAAVNGAFEVDATRDAQGRITLNLVTRDSSGAHIVKKINPNGTVNIFEGLPGFFHAALKDSNGNTVVQGDTPFCPEGGFFFGFFGSEARSDPTGPDRPTYPYFCGSDLTKRTPWGLDKGWAEQLFTFLDGTNVGDGDYTLSVSINSTYVRQLGIDPSQASASTALTVTTEACDPQFGCAGPKAALTNNRRGEGPGRAAAGEAQGNNGLTSNGTPNMEALPAHDFFADNNPNGDGHDYLDFAATIWNGGSGPFVLEGFRQGDQPVMDAVQFIYNNGVPGAPQNVGQFEFDTRPGHEHWHLEDVAQYDLLDSTGARVVLSEKQSFCLAPTDPVDLLGAGADWQPDRIGLYSACAGEDSIWLREVLPAGWGDTYFQGVAGQSFDITDLPNGTYQIRVTTDPFHNLIETNYNDNVSVVAVKIGGTLGNRTVSPA